MQAEETSSAIEEALEAKTEAAADLEILEAHEMITNSAETSLSAHPLRDTALAFGKNNFHVLLYSGIGLVIAILCMTLGPRYTALIVVLMGIGALIGRYQDGGTFLRRLVMRILRRYS